MPRLNNNTATPSSVIDYAAVVPTNRYATPAVIVGVAGFLLPFIPAIIAIALGRRGLRVAREDPRAGGAGASKTGIVLGVLALIFWCGLAAAAVPALERAREQQKRVACLSNLRQISMGVMMYSANNKGYVPSTLDDLVASGILPMSSIYTCPAAPASAGKPVAVIGTKGLYSYHYLGAGRKIADVRNAAKTPLLFEPLTNHDGTSINVAFFDGHCEALTGAAATAFLAANPPPTTVPTVRSAATAPAVEAGP